MAENPQKKPMTDEHKVALAEGRNEGRTVRIYLKALEAQKPKRGPRRTPESLEKQLASLAVDLDKAEPLKRLHLIQERLNLRAELDQLQQASAAPDNPPDITALEMAFVDCAKAYSARKGISYAAWREYGVKPAVLKRADISRS